LTNSAGSTSQTPGSIGPLMQDSSDLDTLVRELVVDHMSLDGQDAATRKQIVSPLAHFGEVAEFVEYPIDPLLIPTGLFRSPLPKSVERDIVIVLLSVR
jgi:hypothetical protein